MSELNVYQRIHAVSNEIGTVGKDGRNDFHKYDYATEASFVHALRPLLYKHGLVIVPSAASIPQVQDGITHLTMKFTIVNIDKPDEKVDMIIPGQGQDKGDKGIYKALTGAKKYFIALAFMVATGDDPEKEDRKDRSTEKTNLPTEVLKVETVTPTNGSGGRASFRKATPAKVTVTPNPAMSVTNGAGDDI